MPERIIRFEIMGVLFVIAVSVFMQNLYEWSGHSVLGIMFGSVNDSIWETCKTLLLPYTIWTLFEVICVKPRFHRFVAARIITIYLLALVFITISLVFSATGAQSHMMPEFIAAIAATAIASAASLVMYSRLEKLGDFFAPIFCLLLLFAALYCSLTVFPPHSFIFMDRATGMYGIIPEYIDLGEFALFN